MKYCEAYAALLDAFYDGECTPEEAAQVREHLAVCPGCRAYLEELAVMSAGFPDEEDPQVPEGFSDSVMAAIRADAAPRKRPSPWKKLLPMAACLAVVVLAAGRLPGMMSGGGSTEAASPSAAAATEEAASSGTAFEEVEVFATTTFSAEDYKAVETPAGEASGGTILPDEEMQAVSGATPAALNDGSAAEYAREGEPEAAKAWSAELTLTAQEAEGLTEGWTMLDTADGRTRYTLTAEQWDALLTALGSTAPEYETGQGELALVTVIQE